MFRQRCLLVLGFLFHLVVSLPVQILVNQRQSECLYDTLEEGEKVTMSVFILSGTTLKATARLEGPIASLETNSGFDLNEAVEKFNRERSKPRLAVNELVDFEHLNIEQEESADAYDSSEDEEPIDSGDHDAEEKKRAHRQRKREKFLEVKRNRERRRLQHQNKIRQEGEPFLQTATAPETGWYRLCVEGTWHQVIAEIEMRKESELGGVDKFGHVFTYEMRELRDEEVELEKDTATQEGIKDEDFQETREKLKELRRLLNEIQSMQQKERRRLMVHATTNEHSHSRMVLGSLLETILFIAVTGYQVFTIRRWFSGSPALGR